METKSRYEVVAELENKKRELIREKNGFADQVVAKQNKIKSLERQKGDTITILDRQIEDAKEELTNFEKTLTERKETIAELVKSLDESLTRFSSLNK